jgi:hypothetical protein
MSDNDATSNGNGRLARIEADITYLRRDVDELKQEINRRLEKIESNLARVVWILIAAVIGAVLAQIGLT